LNTSTNEEHNRDEYLFQHLIAMFQSLAFQQLGKLVNPITGKVEGDLQQAKITIDMLVMIQKKTEGNLADREKQLLDRAIMELQMNYVEELNTKDLEEEKEDSGDIEEGKEEEGEEKESEEKSKTESDDNKKGDN
jgi:hypothetical protein